MSEKIIQKNIKTIVATGNKLNMLIHETAVLILVHSSPKEAGGHGDCSLAKDLLNSMPASMRRTMLQLWFETYSPIRFQMKEGAAVKVGMLKETAKGFTPFDVEAARETPFFTLAEQNPENNKVFDFDAILKLINGLSARIDKKLESGDVPEADQASVRAASAAVKGLRLVRVDGVAVDTEENPPLNLRAVA